MSTVKILPIADKWLKDQYGYCKRNYSRTEVLSLMVKFQQHLLQQTDCYAALPKSEVEQCSNCRHYTNKGIDTDRGLCYLDGIPVLPHHYCPLFKGNVV